MSDLLPRRTVYPQTRRWALLPESKIAHLGIRLSRPAESLARASIAAFLRAGESITTFEAHLVLAAAQLGRGDRDAARQTLAGAADHAPVVDPQGLANFSRLEEAAFDGVPFSRLSGELCL